MLEVWTGQGCSGVLPGSPQLSEGGRSRSPLGVVSPSFLAWQLEGRIIDSAGRLIEATSTAREFDKDDPSVRWVQKDNLWGLQRADGTWLVEPKFQQADPLSGGLARVTLNGKVGFIDRTGKFAIEPVFDKAWPFLPGLDRTSAARDGVFGVIDKTGAWIFQTSYEQVHYAFPSGNRIRNSGDATRLALQEGGPLGLAGPRRAGGAGRRFRQFDHVLQRRPAARLEGQGTTALQSGWHPAAAAERPLRRRLMVRQRSALCLESRRQDRTGRGRRKPRNARALRRHLSGQQKDIRNVKLDGKWGRIALDGQWLIEAKYDYISPTGGPDLFVAGIGDKRGVLRSDGTWLIEPRFDAARIRTPHTDTAFVTISGATGLMRLKDQSWVIAPRPGTMCDIIGAILSRSEGKRAFLSREGETWIDIECGRNRPPPRQRPPLVSQGRRMGAGRYCRAGDGRAAVRRSRLLRARRHLGQARRALVRHRQARQTSAEHRLHRSRPQKYATWLPSLRRRIADSAAGAPTIREPPSRITAAADRHNPSLTIRPQIIWTW